MQRNAYLLPAIPGFPKTPCVVISEVAGTHDPIKYQIRLTCSGAFACVPAYRLAFTEESQIISQGPQCDHENGFCAEDAGIEQGPIENYNF